MTKIGSCDDSYLGNYIDAVAMSTTKPQTNPICNLAGRCDIWHFVRVESIIKRYDLKITCKGTIRDPQGSVEFECETDNRVTTENWPDTTKWIKPRRAEEFQHVQLRGVTPGSEKVEVEIEATACDGWVTETPPGKITIYVTC